MLLATLVAAPRPHSWARFGRRESSLVRPYDGLRPIFHTQLRDDVRHVVADGLLAEIEPARDVLVAEPSGATPIAALRAVGQAASRRRTSTSRSVSSGNGRAARPPTGAAAK
jgi:hypothetical protein